MLWDWSKFDQEHFVLDYISVDQKNLLKIDELNVDSSIKIYLDEIKKLSDDAYAPLKKSNKYKLNFWPRSWITLGLQKSIYKWLRYWIPNPGVLCTKPLGSSKVDSVFHPSKVDKMSITNFWELSGQK